MPFSTSKLFYKDLQGKVLTKFYERKTGSSYYLNGDVFKDKNGDQTNLIFPKIAKKIINQNLKACCVPD